MNLGDQFKAIIERKAQGFGQVAEGVALDISEAVKENTRSGRAFGDDRYDNWYEPDNVKAGQTVTLRNGKSRIESQNVTVVGQGKAQIRFNDSKGGEIFRYHHEGIQYRKAGFKQRSIFPKKVENVPTEIREKMRIKIKEMLQ